MRKRSNYKPRPQLINPVQWVLEGMTPMRHNSEAVAIKIRNHQAMVEMTNGNAGQREFSVIDTAMIMAGGMAQINPDKLGRHLMPEIDAAIMASLAMFKRAKAKGVYRFTGPEMQAINLGMEIHDQQLDTCTLEELHKAVVLVKPVIMAREKALNAQATV
jgi:hypothetical protein